MTDASDYKWVDPYDCNDQQSEPRPDLVAYQPVFTELNRLITEAIELLRIPVQKSPFSNVMTKSLLEEAKFRTDERVSDKVSFAVVGDMASGKSSLINSVLGIGMVARKGNSGASCTWVVQRFMKMFEDQISPFAAKVYFFNSDEIKAILRSLISRYYQAKGKGDDSGDEGEGDDDDGEDFSEKSTVLEAMMPLFCDQPEFETMDAAIKFLDTIQAEDDEVMLDRLTDWADTVKDHHLKSNDFVQVSASTSGQLIGKLQPYTSSLEGEFGRGRTQPWPLVRMVDFGLNIPMLNDGVVLVDSPGITDANSIRAGNAKAQHAVCSHKIHVAKVGRARDDKSLRTAMADNYKWRGAQNSILVLTHGEEIDRETEVIGSELSKQMEKNLRDQVNELLLRKEKLASNIKMACLEERFAIEDELAALRPKLRQLAQELDTCRLRMRNEHTRLSIQQRYKQISGDKRPLPVFVVSNDCWNIHQSGYCEDEKPNMSVEETGLPALRNKLYEMPAQAKLNDTVHLAEHQLPRLINSFEAFCSRTYIARKAEIEEIILQPQKEWAGIQQRTVERMNEEVRKAVLQTMKDDEDQWIRKARRLCSNWGVKYLKKHLQMLKKEGYQVGRTRKDSDIDWNSELLAINKDDLEECFKELLPKLRPCYDEMWEEVKRKMEEAKKNLRRDSEFNLMALNRLCQTFNLEKTNAGQLVKVSIRRLRNGVTDILEETVRCPRVGYLARAMRPIYTGVQKNNKGKAGVIKQRIRDFETQVCKRSGVLMAVHDMIEDAFEHLFQKELTALGKNLDGVFDGINRTFERMCDNAVAKTDIQKQQEAALIQRLNKAVVKARDLADGRIKELANECKNYGALKANSLLFMPKA